LLDAWFWRFAIEQGRGFTGFDRPPESLRAARALLDLTQPELAEAAGLGLSTIVDFEKSRRDVSRAAVYAMQKALEKAGVQFIAKNGGGPGVRC
jgi:transcriptional regulator with XRE-family HTH domain